MVLVDALGQSTRSGRRGGTRSTVLVIRRYVPHNANDQALDALFISTLLYETGSTTI
jgi:hypothetical protein